jgi:uncharacterized membrane protein YhiD involved in acid resistance
MANNVWDSISRNLLKWLVGVIAAAMVTLAGAGIKFYVEWKEDEATEDAEKEAQKTLMFDSVTQKEEHKDHIKETPSALEQHLKIERDAQFQEQLEKHMKAQDCLMTRLNDQYYQLKEEVIRQN